MKRLPVILVIMLIITCGLPGRPVRAGAAPEGQRSAEQISPDKRLALSQQVNGAGEIGLLGQIGGGSYAVAIQGNLAYLGVGPRLVVLNISNPAQPIPSSWGNRTPCQVTSAV